ncbi:hypothetical protein [Streptacidiphilus cavernicola]|uniref:Uncharacterized protein n=1 Tax=Streptacidiphilus cavernicola TaxID=3342716 RepID=A0ABV6W5A0_9ACTN
MYRIVKIASALILTAVVCVGGFLAWGQHRNSDQASRNRSAAVEEADRTADSFARQLAGSPSDQEIKDLAGRKGLGIPRITTTPTGRTVAFRVNVPYSDLSFGGAAVSRCYQATLPDAVATSVPC